MSEGISISHGKIANLARWILCLPGAYLAGFAAYAACKVLIGAPTLVKWTAPVDKWQIECMASAAMGAVFVYAGRGIAPNHKGAVAWTILALTCVAALLASWGAIIEGSWISLTYHAAAILGSALAFADLFRKNRFDRLAKEVDL